ncbi:MAG: methyltransferase domain-containing protein [Candidatus Moraniibacteriota bacterium]|nr:MAG: methyltransferase domain-containing protein [Candidatus Moranbacteria bacterium]
MNTRDSLIRFASPIRAFIMRTIFPRSSYFLFSVPKRRLKPISSKFGYDRGTPIDRFYIESFLENVRSSIQGKCLEVTDDAYTKRFGGASVTESHVVDIDAKNPHATIYADLRDMRSVASNTFDTMIATHTFGVIDDFEAAIRECSRVLKPGGMLIATVSSLGVAADPESAFWRFTKASARYVFGKYFDKQSLEISTLGNVLSGQAFWVGLAAEELSEKELAVVDERYPIVVCIRARKL